MADRATWRRLHADATDHWIDTLKRSALDLDRQGAPWTDEEVVAMLTALWDRAWQTVDALKPERT